MKQLKIGILGTRGIPNQYGGFEQFAGYLSVGLQERGHAVWVYNPHTHPYQQKEWNGVQIIHCKDPGQTMGTAGQFFYDRNCLNDARKRGFDVLLHLGYTSDSVWYRRWSGNMIHMVNMDGLEWKRDKYGRASKWFLKKAERWAAVHADVLVADSPVIKEYLEGKYDKEVFFIPYAADVFSNPDRRQLERFGLRPSTYYVAISRMVPENNIETIIRGWLASGQAHPLLIVGGTDNHYGRYLARKYKDPGIVFTGPVYDNDLLNNLRHHSLGYFHGHSVGGTNPSLLEAMACSCPIIAHDNAFNKAVLGDDAHYFNNELEIAGILKKAPDATLKERRVRSNLEKISLHFNIDRIVSTYEECMLNAKKIKK